MRPPGPWNCFTGLDCRIDRLIDDGFLRMVYGGAADGSYLYTTQQWAKSARRLPIKPMWISFSAQFAGKQSASRTSLLMQRRFTGELGNVTAFINLTATTQPIQALSGFPCHNLEGPVRLPGGWLAHFEGFLHEATSQ